MSNIAGSTVGIVTPLLSFAIALILVPVAKRVGVRFGITALPAHDGPEVRPVPVLGGAAIVIALLTALGLTENLPTWIAGVAVSLLALGTLDDAITLTPRQKFLAQAAVAFACVIAGPRFRLTPWPILDFAIEAFWLLATTNAFNLIDGLDGLASGIGVVASIAIAAAAWLHHDLALACGALALGGALAGFLVYNFHPASIFMGDAGALPIGMLLGVFSLEAAGLSKGAELRAFVFPLLVMLVPLLDTSIVTATRMITGNSISRHGLDHSHHRLLAFGLSDERVVMLCWAVSAVAGLCAVGVSVIARAWLICAIPFIALAAALICLFMMDLTFDAMAPGMAYRDAPLTVRLFLGLIYKRRMVEIVLDALLITASFFAAVIIRYDFAVSDKLALRMMDTLPSVLLPSYGAFFAAHIYRGIWRYTALPDLRRFFSGAALAGVAVFSVSLLGKDRLSFSVTILFVILLFNFLLLTRLSFRALHKSLRAMASRRQRVLLVGAGQMGTVAALELSSRYEPEIEIVGFVDDDPFKLGKLVAGYRVLDRLEFLERVYWHTRFDQIVIAMRVMPQRQLALVQTFAARRNLELRRFSFDLLHPALEPEAAAELLPAKTAG